MGDRSDEADTILAAVVGTVDTPTLAGLRMTAILIDVIEATVTAHCLYMEDIRDSLQGLEAMEGRRAEREAQVEPLTAEQSIPQTDAILELLRRKQDLRDRNEAKARVTKENPPQADPKKSDG